VTALAVLVGLLLGLWVATIAATAYALYFWVYKPWGTMRKDMTALAQQVSDAVALINRERVMALSDEEIAQRESQLHARRVARGAR